MRQYVILYKRGNMKDFKRLQPAVDANLYDKPEVNEAIYIMSQAAHIEGIAVRLDDELFNVFSLTQPALAPNAFAFTQPDELVMNEPVDSRELLTAAGLK